MFRIPVLRTTLSRRPLDVPLTQPSRAVPSPARPRVNRRSYIVIYSLPFALLAVLLLAGCGRKNNSRHVELVMGSDSPAPSTTFELRFESIMVKGDRVGLPTTNSPLVIRPALAGTFTWLSPRTGVFTPIEPLALDTSYHLSLAPALRCADGQPSDASLHWTVTTPAFGLSASWPQRPSDNAHSEPEIQLVFNANVRADDAGRFLDFTDQHGNRMPADVRQGTSEEVRSSYDFGYVSLHTWQQDAAAMNRTNVQLSSGNPTNEVPNLLIVTPQHPLPVGTGWKLIVVGGLPNADRSRHSRAQVEVPIGNITPFEVLAVTTSHYVSSQPTLRVEFSKSVPEALVTNYPAALELSYVPPNLTVSVSGRALTLSGNFPSETNLTLAFRPGFTAVEPFALQGSNCFPFTVPHIAPRLYFPALSCDQLADGNRTFPLLSVNVARLRLRVKIMDPATAIHALRGFESYFARNHDGRGRDDWDEPYRQLDYNLLPGTTIFDKVLDLGRESADSDLAKKLDLNWDDLLGGRQTGVAFLDARMDDEDNNRAPALGTQALIQLTGLGLLWKRSPSGVDIFVFSHRTGLPVAGATACLAGNENQILQQAITDTNGLAHFHAHTNAAWVAAQSGNDFHAIKFAAGSLPAYRFNLPTATSEPDSDSDESSDQRRVMLFSDRDVYRPGESMHLEAIVRDWDPQGLHIPADLTGTLVCTDACNKAFFQTNATFNSLGSWSLQVPLTTEARGTYSAHLHLGTNDQDYIYEFQVADFHPDAFEIQLPCQDAYAAGEPVRLPLSARYLFGKPLARAQVAWSLQACDTDFHPDKFTTYNFHRSDFRSQYNNSQSSQSLNGRGLLTGGTNFIIAPNLLVNPIAPQPRTVSLLAEVTDVNQQTLSHRVEFVRHSSDFYLGLRQGTNLLTTNMPVPLEIVALGTAGHPLPETVPAHLTLQRMDWQTVRLQGAGKTVRFRNETVFTNVLERDISVPPVPEPGTNDDDATGNRIADLPALPAGHYLIEVKAQDAGGRPVISSLGFDVTAPVELGWNYHDDVQLTLKPGRNEYAPGDTADILVAAPFSGTVLVTVERESVLRAFTTQLEGNAPVIHLPLLPTDVPNVFVSVTLLRGSDQSPHAVKEPEDRMGYCTLSVMDPRTKLTVDITPASTNILPGAPVEVAVQITDATRQPATNAEVVLYAVDDGILSLTAYALPDLHSFFYAERPLNVQSGLSLPNLLSEDLDGLRFENKGYLGGGGGESEHVRKNFLACAFWNATLRTDASGQVHARFIAPDSLTRYRLLAVAHTAGSQFGSGQSAFHVTKPLVVEPALPSIANLTDHLIARGLVLNQTTNSGEVIVSLTLDDKARATSPEATPDLTRRVSIPANGSAVVEFPVEFTDPGESKWVWQAHFADAATGHFTDAVQSMLAVGHIAPMLGEVLLNRVTVQTNLLALANPQLLAGRGTITVSVANTRLNELAETAAQLLHYPYGCAEQTGSSLLPWILLRDAPGLLPGASRPGPLTNDATAAIHAGVTRLFSMQTPSGGLGYWPHSREPMLWASAYGGMVLALAQRHGVAVPDDDLGSLLNYLSQQLRSTSAEAANLSDRCLALYALALAGRAEPAYHEKLYSKRALLSAENRALLALAIAESHGPDEMVAELLRPGTPIPSDDTRFGCATREDAIRLLAWIASQPGNPAVDHLVEDLMREQKTAHWETTQGNAWALLALTEYARRVETQRHPAAGQLQYAGQTIPFRLDEHPNVFSQSFTISNAADVPLLLLPANLPGTTNRLYTTVTIEARVPETQQPRQDRGLSLQRRYDRLDDDNQPQDLTGLRVGDRVLVTLRLSVREPARYVAINDALPATLEAVNPEFRTQEARSTVLADDETWWASDFREIRKDRCLWFADRVEPGTYVLRYLARVRAAGTVTAPSAKAEEMYHPERCGLTESQILTTESLK